MLDNLAISVHEELLIVFEPLVNINETNSPFVLIVPNVLSYKTVQVGKLVMSDFE